jgi:hypothetical protein
MKDVLDKLTPSSGALCYFMVKYGLNYIIDPEMSYTEIPLPYRNRLFLPQQRKKNDPISFKKVKGKIIKIYGVSHAK